MTLFVVVNLGNGFDFLSHFVSGTETKSKGLAFYLIVHLVFCVIILYNGMIGIFGSTFKVQKKEEEEDEAEQGTEVDVVTNPKTRNKMARVELLRQILDEVQILKHEVATF